MPTCAEKRSCCATQGSVFISHAIQPIGDVRCNLCSMMVSACRLQKSTKVIVIEKNLGTYKQMRNSSYQVSSFQHSTIRLERETMNSFMVSYSHARGELQGLHHVLRLTQCFFRGLITGLIQSVHLPHITLQYLLYFDTHATIHMIIGHVDSINTH